MHPCRLRQRAQDLLHAIQGPGQQWRVVTIGRGAHGSERMPSASTPTERLMPPFPRSTGLLPDLSPPQGALVMQQSTARSERRATRAREASAISAMRGSSVSPGSARVARETGSFRSSRGCCRWVCHLRFRLRVVESLQGPRPHGPLNGARRRKGQLQSTYLQNGILQTGGPASVGSFERLSACRLDRSEDKV